MRATSEAQVVNSLDHKYLPYTLMHWSNADINTSPPVGMI